MKENGKEFILSLIFKQAPCNERRRKVFSCEECFHREIFMYETVLPIFSKMEHDSGIEKTLRYADLYATSKLPGSESLIIEDLTVEGYEMKNRKQVFDLQHCISVMKFFGTLHTFSFILKKRNPELYKHISNLPETFLNKDFLEYYQSLRMEHTTQRIVACFDAEKEKHLIDKVKEFAGQFTEHCLDCFSEDTAEGYTVINHGDSWINNIFFKYEVSFFYSHSLNKLYRFFPSNNFIFTCLTI